MARSLRQLSTQCGTCGVIFDEQHPKQPKRALCKGCYIIEAQKHSKEQRERRAVVGAAINRIALYRDYKIENRKEFWASINKEIKGLTNREDVREFISKQMDRILNDRKLMEYINLKSEENKK
jgi:hypothetical protein